MKLPHGSIEEVANRVWVCTPNPGEGTMGVVIGSDGKAAVDTSSYSRFACMVKEAIDAHSPEPWRCVVTTHFHFDHVGGNQVFEMPILAAKLTFERMCEYTPEWLEERFKGWLEQDLLDRNLVSRPCVILPRFLFKSALSVRLGDLTLEITHLGGHSEDSSVVFLPERGVLFAGDMVFNGKPASIHDADTSRWLRGLKIMQQMEPDVVVAGHGPPGGPGLLSAQIEELESLDA